MTKSLQKLNENNNPFYQTVPWHNMFWSRTNNTQCKDVIPILPQSKLHEYYVLRDHGEIVAYACILNEKIIASGATRTNLHKDILQQVLNENDNIDTIYMQYDDSLIRELQNLKDLEQWKFEVNLNGHKLVDYKTIRSYLETFNKVSHAIERRRDISVQYNEINNDAFQQVLYNIDEENKITYINAQLRTDAKFDNRIASPSFRNTNNSNSHSYGDCVIFSNKEGDPIQIELTLETERLVVERVRHNDPKYSTTVVEKPTVDTVLKCVDEARQFETISLSKDENGYVPQFRLYPSFSLPECVKEVVLKDSGIDKNKYPANIVFTNDYFYWPVYVFEINENILISPYYFWNHTDGQLKETYEKNKIPEEKKYEIPDIYKNHIKYIYNKIEDDKIQKTYSELCFWGDGTAHYKDRTIKRHHYILFMVDWLVRECMQEDSVQGWNATHKRNTMYEIEPSILIDIEKNRFGEALYNNNETNNKLPYSYYQNAVNNNNTKVDMLKMTNNENELVGMAVLMEMTDMNCLQLIWAACTYKYKKKNVSYEFKYEGDTFVMSNTSTAREALLNCIKLFSNHKRMEVIMKVDDYYKRNYEKDAVIFESRKTTVRIPTYLFVASGKCDYIVSATLMQRDTPSSNNKSTLHAQKLEGVRVYEKTCELIFSTHDYTQTFTLDRICDESHDQIVLKCYVSPYVAHTENNIKGLIDNNSNDMSVRIGSMLTFKDDMKEIHLRITPDYDYAIEFEISEQLDMFKKLDRYVEINEKCKPKGIQFSFHIKEKTRNTDECVIRIGLDKHHCNSMKQTITEIFPDHTIKKEIEIPCKYMIKLDAASRENKTNLVHVITPGDIGRVVNISEQSICFDFRTVRQAFWTTEINPKLLGKNSIIKQVEENTITFCCDGEEIKTTHPYNIPHVRDSTVKEFEMTMKTLFDSTQT